MNRPLLSAGSQSVLLLLLKFSFGWKPCSYFMKTNNFKCGEVYHSKGGKEYISFSHILFTSQYVLLKSHLFYRELRIPHTQSLVINRNFMKFQWGSAPIETERSNSPSLHLTSTTSLALTALYLGLIFFICKAVSTIAPTSHVSMIIKWESIDGELRIVHEI